LNVAWAIRNGLPVSVMGQMLQAGSKNKYRFDIQVSAADMALKPALSRQNVPSRSTGT
jgi:hypothetical protein